MSPSKEMWRPPQKKYEEEPRKEKSSPENPKTNEAALAQPAEVQPLPWPLAPPPPAPPAPPSPAGPALQRPVPPALLTPVWPLGETLRKEPSLLSCWHLGRRTTASGQGGAHNWVSNSPRRLLQQSFWGLRCQQRGKTKEPCSHENWSQKQRFLDTAFRIYSHGFLYDSNYNSRATYIGPIFTQVSLHTSCSKYSLLRDSIPPSPLLLLFPQQTLLYLTPDWLGLVEAENWLQGQQTSLSRASWWVLIPGFVSHMLPVVCFFLHSVSWMALPALGLQACDLPSPGLKYSCPKICS